MFFVGITGQLITLILTVSLPIIFLMSGNHEIKDTKQTLSFNNHQSHQEFSSINFNSFEFEQNYSAEIYKKNIKIEESDFIKIPYSQINVKQKLLYLNYSGNKAPPTSIYFSC